MCLIFQITSEFQALLQCIRDNVSAYLKTGDVVYMRNTSPAWGLIYEAGAARIKEANDIFQAESLAEMQTAIDTLK